MGYEYTAFILLLPLLSFLVLGLAGMKMSHKTAGLIGPCSLGVVTLLSYIAAFQYFPADAAHAQQGDGKLLRRFQGRTENI